MSLAAVVVHYRTPARLRECLAALEQQGDSCGEVVVVDNSSSIDPAEPPGTGAPWRLRQAAGNLGFGAACNLGASLTNSDYLLFLNADLVLDDRACESLRAVAEQYARAAVIGPRIRGADGEIELSARSFPSLSTGVLGRSTLPTRLLRRLAGPPNQMSSALSDHTTIVDWVSGACMLVRRDAFDDVGGFDEGYWMYWEDADLCRRLSRRGWSTMLCVEATARHSTGASGQSEQTVKAFHNSAARYYERHVARTHATAAIARGILTARMRIMLHRYAARAAGRPDPVRDHSGPGSRILIDALAARFGGTAYASVHLARQLARREDVSSVIVATRAGSIVARGLADEPLVRCIALPATARIELLRRVIWEALRLPAVVASEGRDVVITMSGMLPRPPRSRVICLLFNPVMYERRTAANVVRRWAVRRTVHNADYFAAPSRALAELASASTGRRCEVVPLGIDHEVFFPFDTLGDEVLCVADFYGHKRHDVVLDAWLRLPPPRPPLRFIGSASVDPRSYQQLLGRIHGLPDAASITVENGVSLGRLVDAYHAARVFVLASEHESFCMPLAESMACGVPAVVRRLSSLRDTGGNGARYVVGDDPALWAAAMRDLMEDDDAHRLARNAALAASARFSWQAFAEAVAAQM